MTVARCAQRGVERHPELPGLLSPAVAIPSETQSVLNRASGNLQNPLSTQIRGHYGEFNGYGFSPIYASKRHQGTIFAHIYPTIAHFYKIAPIGEFEGCYAWANFF
jgi:hypothetical protein